MIHDDTPLIPLGLAVICFLETLTYRNSFLAILPFTLFLICFFWFLKAMSHKREIESKIIIDIGDPNPDKFVENIVELIDLLPLKNKDFIKEKLDQNIIDYEEIYSLIVDEAINMGVIIKK